jgi:hypothetical protein
MESYNDDEDRELKIKTENAADNTKGGLEEMGDKMKAGAKAMGNKMKDPDRDTETEYDKEKLKEDTN